MVKELKTERSASYDYLQKDTPGGGADNSEHDDESHGTHSDAGDADVQGGESQDERAGSMQTEEAEALLVTSPPDLNKASLLVRQSVATSAMMQESSDLNRASMEDASPVQMVIEEEEDKEENSIAL